MSQFSVDDDMPPLKDDVLKDTPREKPKRATKPRTAHDSKTINIQNGVTELYTAVGLLVSILSPKDGEIVVAHAVQAGEVWDRAAKRNPRIKKALESFLTASTVAEVFVLHISIAMKIAANHELVPENLSAILKADEEGYVPPDLNGFDPSTIPAEVLEEIFPQMKK